MEEIARVYADALFRAAKEDDKLDVIQQQLAQFVGALRDDRDLKLFLFSPYFSSQEKRDGLRRAIDGAEPELLNFLELLAEKHRLPVIFRIERQFEQMWKSEKGRLDVIVTSAVDLDPEISDRIGSEIEKQTGRTVELQRRVDNDILGGLVVQVGNMVLDASVRNRLDKLRKSVAGAA
ncbi:MAG: F0F1 ATP synthase subunit delta [Solirubrobacterales bacterium]|nr:F0F1 ATP synthase subunit delta [Solirubrobacterales bacterium]